MDSYRVAGRWEHVQGLPRPLRARYQREISLERAVGITGIIDQWTVDEDANQAYYPDRPAGTRAP